MNEKPWKEDTPRGRALNEIYAIIDATFHDHNWHGASCSTCVELLDKIREYHSNAGSGVAPEKSTLGPGSSPGGAPTPNVPEIFKDCPMSDCPDYDHEHKCYESPDICEHLNLDFRPKPPESCKVCGCIHYDYGHHPDCLGDYVCPQCGEKTVKSTGFNGEPFCWGKCYHYFTWDQINKPSGDGKGGSERPTDSATEKTGTTGVEVESHAHVEPAPETPEGKKHRIEDCPNNVRGLSIRVACPNCVIDMGSPVAAPRGGERSENDTDTAGSRSPRASRSQDGASEPQPPADTAGDPCLTCPGSPDNCGGPCKLKKQQLDQKYLSKTACNPITPAEVSNTYTITQTVYLELCAMCGKSQNDPAHHPGVPGTHVYERPVYSKYKCCKTCHHRAYCRGAVAVGCVNAFKEAEAKLKETEEAFDRLNDTNNQTILELYALRKMLKASEEEKFREHELCRILRDRIKKLEGGA